MKQPEIAEIESLIENGLVTKRKHPNMDIWICNYTPRMQYESAWTPVGERCRGLIVDSDWNVIANPFPKFYNLFEKIGIESLPDELPVITEKLDGFLGVGFSENGLPAISTRGSFESPMAVWGTKWIRSTNLVMDDFMSNYTYLFEIISPTLCREQGLIIDYGARAECVLLAVRNTETGNEIDHISEAINLNLPYAKEYTGSLDDAIALMPIMGVDESEGFVCKYSNGLRIKLKSDEYKRLHRLLKGLSPKRILNTLIEHGDEGINDMLEGVPDETFARVHTLIKQIRDDQANSIREARKVCESVADLPTMQEKATIISKSPYKSVAFVMLNDGDYEMVALKMVRKIIKDLADDTRKT